MTVENRSSFGRWLGVLGIIRPSTGGSLLPLLLTAGMLSGAALLHYGDQVPAFSEAADRSPVAPATRQSMERILILVPVAYATFVFGAQGGIITAIVGFGMLFPRALIDTGHTDHALPELAGVMVVGSLLIVAITQQQREAEAQEKMRGSLQFFVRQVLTSQEDERKRIAQELHDDTAQVLLLACQRLDRLAADANTIPPEASQELKDLRAEMVRALTDLRRMTQHLRPRIFDDHGLVPALEWLADSLEDQYGIQASVRVIGQLPEHSPETQLLLFRIAQEALRNIGRHSRAQEAVVTLRGRQGWISLSVADDGRGFRLSRPLEELAEAGSLGLLGMSERARLVGGTLTIRTAPGTGTLITAELPCTAPLPSAIHLHETRVAETLGQASPPSEFRAQVQ